MLVAAVACIPQTSGSSQMWSRSTTTTTTGASTGKTLKHRGLKMHIKPTGKTKVGWPQTGVRPIGATHPSGSLRTPMQQA